MLRPFLLIGVGGSGGKTLRVVRDDLRRRLQQSGWTGDLPQAWQFIHIDVPTVADGNDPDLPEQLPVRDYQGLVANGVDYATIDASMTQRSGSHLTAALGGWLPNPNRVNIPVGRGAGQFRALGRVITLAGLGSIREALQTARRHLTGAEGFGELQEVSRILGGTSALITQEPTVLVVTSLAGGSGSGAVIDVCDALRAIGENWANESVGLLYAPDVFDYLPEEARRGVRPNSLAALSELLSGYWNEDGPSAGTTELFARYGVQLGAARRLGPRYPFLVGARNEHVSYRTQNDIYRAMGKSVASWMVSPVLQDRLSAYIQTQWAATAVAVPDRLPLHSHGTETPFVALGSSRVGLGRDRFRDYASEHLARTVVERFLHRHEELRGRGDDRTERQLVRDTADAVFGGFLEASGLNERGEEQNQILDALRPVGLKDDLKGLYTDVLEGIRQTIPDKGGRAVDVRRGLRTLTNDRRSQFQTSELAKRLDTARGWVASIQQQLLTITARSIATNGAPVTLEVLRRLATETDQVRDELRAEAAVFRRWASELEQQIRGALDDADTATILRTTDRLGEAVKRAVQTFAWEQEAEIRDLAAELIPDLKANYFEPLIEAVAFSIEALGSERGIGRTGRGSVMALWPTGNVIPERLRPAPNEFLLEGADDYPGILADLVRRTVDTPDETDARRQADIQVLLGTDRTESGVQRLISRTTNWVPRNHLLHSSVTAAPARASFHVDASPEDILERGREWLHREGTAVGRYMAEGLRDYLDPEQVAPAEFAQRLSRFEGQLIAALNAGAPLVSINPSVLVQVHDRRDISYAISFSEVPLPDKSPARDLFRTVLEARDQWSDGVMKAFTDGDGAFIDIFTVLGEPYEPVVFDSLMKPVASEWGARNKSADQRSEFWRWRRSRPLPESLPFSPAVLDAMIRGWFVAGCLDHISATEEAGVRIFVPAERGKGGEMSAFPWPTLTSAKVKGPELLPALLESVSLALLEVNATESLSPMRPYERLLQLGQDKSDVLPEELETWIREGVNLNGTVDGGDDGSESRQAAIARKLEELETKFTSHFDQIAQRTELLDYPGSYELRHSIKAALGDLRRAVATMEPTAANEVFF